MKPAQSNSPAVEKKNEFHKKQWLTPIVELISNAVILSGAVPGGREGQPTAFASPPTLFISMYHS